MSTTHGTVARTTGNKRWSALFLAGAAAIAGLAAAPSNALAGGRDRDDRDFSRFRDGRVDIRYEDRCDERRVWVQPVYRTVCEQVWIAPEYRTECERIWCPPVTQTICEKVWCPDRYQVREIVSHERGRRVIRRERILVERGHWVNQERQVVVRPGEWKTIERQVLVCEGHYKTVERQELVRAGHWETVAERRYDRPWNLGFSINF
jgi:hypothetical protein